MSDLIDRGEYSDAIHLCDIYQENNPIQALILKTRIHRDTGHYEKALNFSNKGISLTKGEKQEDYYFIYFERIKTKWRIGLYEDALKEINKLFEELKRKSFQKEIFSKISAAIYLLRGNIYGSIGHNLTSLQDHMLSLSLYEQSNDSENVALLHNNLGYTLNLLGQLDEAESYLHQSLEYSLQSGNPLDTARTMINLGQIYSHRGDFIQARNYFHQGLNLQKSLGNFKEMAYTYYELINLSITLNRISEAENYYEELDLNTEFSENKFTVLQRNLSKAMIKMQDSRYKSKVVAIKILERVISSKIVHQVYTLTAIRLLCELLFEELEMFEDIRILSEIEKLVDAYKEFGGSNSSILVKTEADLLRSHICLIEGDVKSAQNILIDAHDTAKANGLTRLVLQISALQAQIEDEIGSWRILTRKEASLRDRIHKADIFTFLRNLNHGHLPIPDAENEIPVMLLIVSEGGVIRHAFKLDDKNELHEHLLGSFLTAINAFFADTFSQQDMIERIKSKNYTIIMKSSNELNYFYIFKGQSYYAMKKLDRIIDELEEDQDYANLVGNWAEFDGSQETIPDHIVETVNSIFVNT